MSAARLPRFASIDYGVSNPLDVVVGAASACACESPWVRWVRNVQPDAVGVLATRRLRRLALELLRMLRVTRVL
jgi:hypothetical protein